MLEGRNVNLRVVEKEDLPMISEWMANPDFLGEYVALWQKSRTRAHGSRVSISTVTSLFRSMFLFFWLLVIDISAR